MAFRFVHPPLVGSKLFQCEPLPTGSENSLAFRSRLPDSPGKTFSAVDTISKTGVGMSQARRPTAMYCLSSD